MAEARNPYRTAPGSTPPELAGRGEALGAAHYALEMARYGEPPNPIVFLGLRGMGKTALLRQIVRDADARAGLSIVVEADRSLRFIDVARRRIDEALERSETIPAKLRASLKRLAGALPRVSYELPHDAGAIAIEGRDDPDAEPSDSIENVLLDLNDRLHEHGRFLTIALDEIQESARLDLLRIVRVVHRTAGTTRPIFFVGAGLPNAADVLKAARTYTERWAYHRLELLSRFDLASAVDAPARDVGVHWTEPALDELYARSHGYPVFVQAYASAAWRHRRGAVIALGDMTAVGIGVQRTLDESLYDRPFAALSEIEAAYVLALYRLGAGPHRSDEIARELGLESSAAIGSTRARLMKKDVLFAPTRGLAEFRIPLTSSYIERHRAQLEKRANLGSGRGRR